MRFICIYTDLNNPANRSKAVVEADEIEIIESSDESSTLIKLVKKPNKSTKPITVFLVQEYRVVELYASEYVETTPIEKGAQQKRNNSNLHALKLDN